MMSFVAKTPARIIVWLNADPARADWPIMMEAVGHFQDRLFLLPNNHANSSKEFEPLRHLPNVLVHNTYEPSTLTRAIIGAVPVTGFMMGSLAHTAAHIWVRDPGQSPAAVKAKLK
jgi:hypothetical protein